MTKIEWCDATINPLGHWCFGPGGTKEDPKPCVYCYAKRIARRGMNGCEKCQSFNVPHTHFEQLDKLTAWKKPKNIFVQSMGDLFHNDVPDEWIETVFKACEKTPHHRYLFLTKNPERYIELNKKGLLPSYPNFWFGTSTVTEESRYWWSKEHNFFVSIEPIMGEFTGSCTEVQENVGGAPLYLHWVIVGSESGNRKGKVIPKREWIENIVNECRRSKVPVFLKNSLASIYGEPLIQEYPWEVKR